jgi:hypothetical protein
MKQFVIVNINTKKFVPNINNNEVLKFEDENMAEDRAKTLNELFVNNLFVVVELA